MEKQAEESWKKLCQSQQTLDESMKKEQLKQEEQKTRANQERFLEQWSHRLTK